MSMKFWMTLLWSFSTSFDDAIGIRLQIRFCYSGIVLYNIFLSWSNSESDFNGKDICFVLSLSQTKLFRKVAIGVS